MFLLVLVAPSTSAGATNGSASRISSGSSSSSSMTSSSSTAPRTSCCAAALRRREHPPDHGPLSFAVSTPFSSKTPSTHPPGRASQMSSTTARPGSRLCAGCALEASPRPAQYGMENLSYLGEADALAGELANNPPAVSSLTAPRSRRSTAAAANQRHTHSGRRRASAVTLVCEEVAGEGILSQPGQRRGETSTGGEREQRAARAVTRE